MVLYIRTTPPFSRTLTQEGVRREGAPERSRAEPSSTGYNRHTKGFATFNVNVSFAPTTSPRQRAENARARISEFTTEFSSHVSRQQQQQQSLPEFGQQVREISTLFVLILPARNCCCSGWLAACLPTHTNALAIIRAPYYVQLA